MDFYVYILSNESHNLYVGFTTDLPRRLHQHKTRFFGAFTARYKFDRIVYYEILPTRAEAERRERAIKGWTRVRKIALIQSTNPWWRNLVRSLVKQLCLE